MKLNSFMAFFFYIYYDISIYSLVEVSVCFGIKLKIFDTMQYLVMNMLNLTFHQLSLWLQEVTRITGTLATVGTIQLGDTCTRQHPPTDTSRPTNDGLEYR